MHIVHTQGIFSPDHGGPTHSLSNYCAGQVRAGHRVSVWALEGFPHTSPAIRLPAPVESHIFRSEFPTALGRSRPMRRALLQAPAPDVFHLHGVWLRAMHYAAEMARRHRVPSVVELMGMYEPYGLAVKPWRKRLARRWFQDEILHGAQCLHVNSAREGEHLRQLGFKAPIAVIPVGVDLDGIARTLPGACPGAFPELKTRPFVLFLSRIQEKKGIELLLRAWAAIRKAEGGRRHAENELLVIAGGGEPGYVARCKSIARELGIEDQCRWVGRVTEPEKIWCYANARFFVLPSHSENYGNAVAEALGCGTPVLTTTGTPWADIEPHGCGWMAEPTLASLSEMLEHALHTSPTDLKAMGKLGAAWCEKSLSLKLVLQNLEQTYAWLRGGTKPTFVTTD